MDDTVSPTRKGRGHFFQVDAHAWAAVTRLGLNASVAYLVLACGTGRNNLETTWSVHAIEGYTGVPRAQARQAIETLCREGAIERLRGGTKPRYLLCPPPDAIPTGTDELGWPIYPEPDWIWLPNSIVVGAANERPPLARVRGLQDIGALRLLISLYGLQDLADCGGIPWWLLAYKFHRKLLTEHGVVNIWGFNEDQMYASRSLLCEFLGVRPEKGEQTETDWTPFWNALRHLQDLGLIERVPHLLESETPAASIIIPCPRECDEATDDERELGDVTLQAAEALLGKRFSFQLSSYDAVLAVPRGYPKVELVGVYRLRYRPRTSRTATWFARCANHGGWLALMGRLIEESSGTG